MPKKKKRKSFGQTFVFPFLFFPLSNNIVVFLFIIIQPFLINKRGFINDKVINLTRWIYLNLLLLRTIIFYPHYNIQMLFNMYSGSYKRVVNTPNLYMIRNMLNIKRKENITFKIITNLHKYFLNFISHTILIIDSYNLRIIKFL